MVILIDNYFIIFFVIRFIVFHFYRTLWYLFMAPAWRLVTTFIGFISAMFVKFTLNCSK